MSKVKGQLVADVLNNQHAGIGATWRINTKILSTCRGRRHIVAAARLQLVIDNFIHRKQTIEHNTNQIKLNNN